MLRLVLTLILQGVFSTIFGMQDRLVLNPSKVIAGSDVSITYDVSATQLKSEKQIYGLAYVYDNYHWRIYDVPLHRTEENKWTGTFLVPQQAGFIALKFQNTLGLYPDIVDNNNNNGYFFQIYTKNNKLMPGAEIGKAVFLSSTVMTALGYMGVLKYFDKERSNVDKESLKTLVDGEKRLYPKNLLNYFYEEVYLYQEIYGKDADPLIRKTLAEVEKNKRIDENTLFYLSFAYRFMLQDQEKAQVIDKWMTDKYPKGRLARRKAMEIPYTLKGEEYFGKAEQVRRDFPVLDFYKNRDYQSYLFNNFYRRLAQELFDSGQYGKLEEVLKEMNSGMIEDAFNHQPKQSMKFPDRDPKQYYDIALKYIEELQSKVDFMGNYDGVTASPLQLKLHHTQNLEYYRTVMTELCRRVHQYERGIEMMDAIPLERRFYYDPAGNEAYVHCLEQLGRDSEIPQVLESSASHGNLTPYMMEKLRTYYDSKVVKQSTSFDEYLYSLKTQEAKDNILKSVKEGLVSESFSPFDIEDIKGGRVRSDDFKEDDIIVLDFWATWCAPCCAALAGMQMTVEKYLNDPKVKFYFVDTQDRATKEQLEKYWKEKGYHDMLIVFDEDTPDSKDKARIYRNFFPNTSGIPQKAILKNGKIRYRASGYMGSPSGLMDEISTVIEELKNE